MQQSEPTTNKVLLAVAWMDLGGGSAPHLAMYKVWRKIETWEQCEVPITLHELEQVPSENYDTAFRWLREHHWRSCGSWYRAKPGLIWSPDFQEVQKVFEDLAVTGRYLEKGHNRLERAPIRYDWRQTERPFVYLRTTRSRRDLWALRAKYPNAGELSFVPASALHRQFGLGLDWSRRMADAARAARAAAEPASA